MSNTQKLTNNIKIPNNDLEALKIHFPQYFGKDENFQFEKFKSNLTQKEINFSTESYCMDWLGKSYARLLATDPATTLLKANQTNNTKPENVNAQNLLIKGDNLEVLKHLTNAYYEQIKMIYIDPPYNTGSDGFVYNDDRKFTIQQLEQLTGIDTEKAKRILNFTQSKSNSHSAWLTFLYPRLYIAKQLLKDDGVIFVSIDDNEVAQLRLLMDEIFGEENFVAELIWKKKAGGGADAKFFADDHEYILCYAKNINNISNFYINLNDEQRKSYNLKDENFEKYGYYKRKNLYQSGIDSNRPNLRYEIISPDGTKILPPTIWRWSKESFNEALQNNEIDFLKNKQNEWQVYTKMYLNKNEEEYMTKPRSILLDSGLTRDGNLELKEIFHNQLFSYPKPTKLIKHILSITTLDNDQILDFFAGSGTTGDAMMQLNAEDGGNRKYILIQLPELIDPKKNKAAYDFVKEELKAEPTIFEITKERLLRAAQKINTNINQKIETLQNELPTNETKAQIKQLENCKNQNNFKVFETTPIWDNYNFEAEELNNQIKLFDESELTQSDIDALLITWKTYDGIALTQDVEKLDLLGYTALYGNNKLYLMQKGFTTDSLISILQKIDNDKNFNPTSIIAFGYNFDSKNLREISENLKSYTNKKNIDIDFITRY